MSEMKAKKPLTIRTKHLVMIAANVDRWYEKLSVYKKKEEILLGSICLKKINEEFSEMEIILDMPGHEKDEFAIEAITRLKEYAIEKESMKFLRIVMDGELEDTDENRLFLKTLDLIPSKIPTEEGFMYEHRVPAVNYFSMYIALGMCLGSGYGVLWGDKMPIGLSIGVALGCALGVAMQKKEDAKQKKLVTDRCEHYGIEVEPDHDGDGKTK